jgi:hypothetical protein
VAADSPYRGKSFPAATVMLHQVAQYRREVEQFYLALICQLINQGYPKLDIALLQIAGRQSPFARLLNERFQALGLDCQTAWEIELATLQSLINYIQAVQQMMAGSMGVNLNFLEFYCQTLRLQPATIEVINSLFITDTCQYRNCQCGLNRSSDRINLQWPNQCNRLSHNNLSCNGSGLTRLRCNRLGCTCRRTSSCDSTCESAANFNQTDKGWYYERLRQYDAALAQAIKQLGPGLNITTSQRLKCLQNELGIAEQDIIRPTEIRSEHNCIDYTELWRLLKGQEWKQANELTWRLMMTARNRTGSLSVRDIADFPCQDLVTIDYLWARFSQNRFCFRTQQQAWIWYQDPGQFVRQVGWVYKDWAQTEVWRSAENLKFSLEAEQGHLPFLPYVVENRQYIDFTQALINRLDRCPIVA